MIHNQRRPVRLLVFNLDQETVREVNVTPDFEWGGQGCLGCDVASGALHRIPPPSHTSDGQPRAAEISPINLDPDQERTKFEETQLTAASVNDQQSLPASQAAIATSYHAPEDQCASQLTTAPTQLPLNGAQVPTVASARNLHDSSPFVTLCGESPKPAVPVMEKVSETACSPTHKATTKTAPPQTNLQPIPGFDGLTDTSGTDDLAFLQ